MPPGADIATRLDTVRRRMEAAAHRVRRDPSDIHLIAVSKTVGTDDIRRAVDAGQTRFGENRIQEALDKMHALSDLALEWHFIGHLQSNKAKKAAAFPWIESVDSLDIVARLDRAALDAGVRPRVLIEVDLAGETTKFGVPEADVARVATAAAAARGLTLEGLMLVPPVPAAPDASRPWFRRLRELRDRLIAAAGVPPERLTQLSMGMSHDFEAAVEEGATLIRVGTAIFGQRQLP